VGFHPVGMMAEVIPEEVKSFLLVNIDSIAQLEALLFLRDHADQTWSCEKIAETIYISQQDTAVLLAKLVTRGLIMADGKQPPAFQYYPRNEELARGLDRLAAVYAKSLIPVTNFIHQKARRSIQDFADAFKLKKDQ
jgi:hypothetical protein